MSWFTIHVIKPESELAKSCAKNCAGQFILFDGEASMKGAMDRARLASTKSQEVQVFCGKTIGKLVATFENGKSECSYCGKAHL